MLKVEKIEWKFCILNYENFGKFNWLVKKNQEKKII
jgi:hypothetical protein